MLDHESGGAADIAVIGMACRVPGAKTPQQCWDNLCRGIDSVREVDSIEAAKLGVTAPALNAKNYIRRRGILDDADGFDAHYFGISAREAEGTDPQHRLFLEVAVEALENAGYDPDLYRGRVGVFGGSSLNPYACRALALGCAGADTLSGAIGMDKDYLTTKIAYRLGLHGPCLSVQTACSTGLVAVHLAAQSLLAGECDMALVGAVSVSGPQHRGNVYEPGGVLSPDGTCKAFSSAADGMVNGSGVVVLVLKRRDDAQVDRDTIHALIKGSAINNDGSDKVGFTAPSQRGQADVIQQALTVAGLSPDDIGYVETHGTGTPLGDAIELAALRDVFHRRSASPLQIGSVKTNIGHIGVAAGMVGLLKAALVVEHGVVPPHLHCATPSKAARDSGFLINNGQTPVRLARSGTVRAGVSSFGIGGTNVHVVIEQPPPMPPSPDDARPQLVVLSAKTESALAQQFARLRAILDEKPGLRLSDVAYTLQVGRRKLPCRSAFVCSDIADLRQALGAPEKQRQARVADDSTPRVVFLFPGGGVQHPGMGRDLYQQEPAFRGAVDECRGILQSYAGFDVLPFFLAEAADESKATEMRLPSRSAVCIFVYQYAMLRLLESAGITPSAVLGHSQGEYACAVATGALSLKDGLTLVHARGSLLEGLAEPGAMVVVEAPISALKPLLPPEVSVVALNAPQANIVAGARPKIEVLAERLTSAGVEFHRVRYGAASHCHLVEPALPAFQEVLQKCTFGAPNVSWMSTVTAEWLPPGATVDAGYWLRQLREPVVFAEGSQRAAAHDNTVFVDIGPQSSLGNLIRSNGIDRPALCASPHANDTRDGRGTLLECLGGLWLRGALPDWSALHAGRQVRREPLPTYPFEHLYFDYWSWSAPQRPIAEAAGSPGAQPLRKFDSPAQWLYLPGWRETPPLARSGDRPCPVVLFSSRGERGAALEAALRDHGHEVTVAVPGAAFERDETTGVIHVRLDSLSDHVALFERWTTLGQTPPLIVHACLAEEPAGGPQEGLAYFHHLAVVARALAHAKGSGTAAMHVLTAGVHDVTGSEPLAPERAIVKGCILAINQEFPDIECLHLDLELDRVPTSMRAVADLLSAQDAFTSAALRGRRWWRPEVFPLEAEQAPRGELPLRERGVYAISGGLGRLGLLIAEHLHRRCKARLVFLSRRELPPSGQWPDLLRSRELQPDLRKTLQSLQRLLDLGAEVLVLSTDVSDEIALRRALATARTRFGRIDGFIHAAAHTTAGWIRPVAELDGTTGHEQARTKVHAAEVLSRVFAEDQPDFVLLMSSIAALLGGIGYAAYAGANAAMDLIAHREFRAGRPFLSVNWDLWDHDLRSGLDHTTLAGLPMKVEKGLEVFDRVLGLVGRLPQVSVSTADLRQRLAQWVTAPEQHVAPRVPSEARLYARPDAPADSDEPLDDVEFVVRGVWQSKFGYERVGLDENFFDLGGHSLLAVRINSELRGLFGVELPLSVQFHHPTVRSLASAITQTGRSCSVDVKAVAATLREVSELTSEELLQLADKKAATAD